MKEIGMVFNADMVRAILSGSKTQTRRIMKVQPVLNGNLYEVLGAAWSKEIKSVPAVPGHSLSTKCPFGQKGNRIWVREAFRFPKSLDDVSPRTVGEMAVAAGLKRPWAPVFYPSTEGFSEGWDGFETPPTVSVAGRFRHSIYMPRWASRITLEITSVRVERLQDIKEEDARSEGLAEITKDGSLFKFGIPDRDGYPGTDDNGWPWHEWERNPVDAYCKLWKSIYGEESWNANPWVWVIEFREVK